MEILKLLHERELDTQQSLSDLLEHVIRPLYRRNGGYLECDEGGFLEGNSTGAKGENPPNQNRIFIPNLTTVQLKALFGPSEHFFENIVSVHKKLVDTLATKIRTTTEYSPLMEGYIPSDKMESEGNNSNLHNDPNILHFLTEQAAYSTIFTNTIVPAWLLLMKGQGLVSGVLSPIVSANNMDITVTDDPDDGFVIGSESHSAVTSVWTTHQRNMKQYLLRCISDKSLNKAQLAIFFAESLGIDNKSYSNPKEGKRPLDSLSLNQLLISVGCKPIDDLSIPYCDDYADPSQQINHNLNSTGSQEQNLLSPIAQVFLILAKPIACANRLMYAAKCQAISTWETQLRLVRLGPTSYERDTNVMSNSYNDIHEGDGWSVNKLVNFCEKVQQAVEQPLSIAYQAVSQYQVAAFFCMLDRSIPSFVLKHKTQPTPFLLSDGYDGDVGASSSSTKLPELLHFGEVGKIHGSVKRVHKRSLFLFEDFLCYTEVVEDKKALALLTLQRQFIEDYSTKKKKNAITKQQKQQPTERWSNGTEECFTELNNNTEYGDNEVTTQIRRPERIRPENRYRYGSTNSLSTSNVSNKPRTFSYFNCCSNYGGVVEMTRRQDKNSLSTKPNSRSRFQLSCSGRKETDDDIGMSSCLGSGSTRGIRSKPASPILNSSVPERDALANFLTSLNTQDAAMVEVLNTSLAAQSLASPLTAYSYAKVLYNSYNTDQIDIKSNSRSSTILSTPFPPLRRNISSQTPIHRTITPYMPPILRHRIRAIFPLCPDLKLVNLTPDNHHNGCLSRTACQPSDLTIDSTELGKIMEVIHPLLSIEDCNSDNFGKNRHCFELVVPSRRYTFFAPSADEKSRWLSSINAARMKAMQHEKGTSSKRQTCDSRHGKEMIHNPLKQEGPPIPSTNPYSSIIAASQMHPFHSYIVEDLGNPSVPDSTIDHMSVGNPTSITPSDTSKCKDSSSLPPLRVALQQAFLESLHYEKAQKYEACMVEHEPLRSAIYTKNLSPDVGKYFPRQQTLAAAYGYATSTINVNDDYTDNNMTTDLQTPPSDSITTAEVQLENTNIQSHNYTHGVGPFHILSSPHDKNGLSQGTTQKEAVDTSNIKRGTSNLQSGWAEQSLDNSVTTSCNDHNMMDDRKYIYSYFGENEQELTNDIIETSDGFVYVKSAEWSSDETAPITTPTPVQNITDDVTSDFSSDSSEIHYLSNDFLSCEEGDFSYSEVLETTMEPPSEKQISLYK